MLFLTDFRLRGTLPYGISGNRRYGIAGTVKSNVKVRYKKTTYKIKNNYTFLFLCNELIDRL